MPHSVTLLAQNRRDVGEGAVMIVMKEGSVRRRGFSVQGVKRGPRLQDKCPANRRCRSRGGQLQSLLFPE